MKIMVCLISRQHVPNLLAIRSEEPNPEKLVLIVSPFMKRENRHNQLLDALKVGGLDYTPIEKHDFRCLKNEYSVSMAKDLFQEIYNDHQNDELIINLTGGTKPMSIGAYEFSLENHLRALYVPEGNQRQAIDLLDNAFIRSLKHKTTTGEFLAGYGFDVINEDKLKNTEEKARSLVKLSAMIASKIDDNGLRGMLAYLQILKEGMKVLDPKGWERNGLNISSEDNVFLDDKDLRDEISSQFGLHVNGTKLIGTLSKHATEFLTGKWLEFFVWSLLEFLVGRGIWDLHLGVSAGKDGPARNNDLDVSFMKNQSLCIVECKTGERKSGPEADNILYKIEAIKSGPKALRVKSYLATTWPEVIDEKTGEIKEALKNRCDLYGCEIVHGAMLREMAKLYLNERSEDKPGLSRMVADAFNINLEQETSK
mgnify:CR=1 FL=1